MNMIVFPIPLPLPGDESWLSAHLAAAGGLAGVPPKEMPRLARTVGALPALRLIELMAGEGATSAPALAQLWLGAHPSAPEAFAVWFNLGVVLLQNGAAEQAAVAYGNALALKPDLHEARVNLGLSLEAQGHRDDALRTWRMALPPDATRRVLHMHLGRLMEEEGRLEEAASELRSSLLIDPDQPDVIQHWVHLRQRMATWPVLDPVSSGVAEQSLRSHAGPLGALALFDDPVAQREVGANWIARKVKPAPERLAPPDGYRHDRIRIGYLSSDFCRHAMSFLIAEVLERHDRAAFEVFGYCASPEDGSDLRARVVAAFDHHVPIGALSDEAAARRIRADEIDILVDLNGLTRGARLGVLRWKPAPVQATYLGYVGPVPLPELDWMICDAVIRRMPLSYETRVEEGGANLSGGQRQRIAIARALLTAPRMLVFDEATSALDPESEALVNRNLADMARGRTLLIVSHRLSTLVRSDAILVLDEGRVVDLAPHAVLLERCAIYRQLWQQQTEHMA